MKSFDKHKKIKTVPLLCWDIYMEHLDKLLGRNYSFEKKKSYGFGKK